MPAPTAIAAIMLVISFVMLLVDQPACRPGAQAATAMA